jgi:hypothetical protein
MTTSREKEQAERKSLAGSNTTTTYHSWAGAHLELERSGRHAAAAKASVTGTEASVRYPRLPENNPFTSDISGVEPPLGYAIDSQEVVGEVFEIAASLANPSGDAEAAREEDGHSTSAARAPSSGPCLPEGGAFIRRGRKL